MKLYIVEIISALFLMLFVYAALAKLMDLQKFRVELGKSPILNRYGIYVSIGIPLTELILSFLLTTKRFQYYALYLSFSLMGLFSAYIIAILKFSPYIPCSCGGILQNMTWIEHLIFNVVFMVLGGAAVLIYPNRKEELTRDKKGSLYP